MDGRHRVGEGIVTKRGICIWDDLRRLHGTVEGSGGGGLDQVEEKARKSTGDILYE